MSKPVAVVISDVHYSLPTLEVADAAMRQAIDKANELGVPLIVAGDLHDTKANLRAECVNRMLATFAKCFVTPYILVGNHCRINEKAPAHALNFLASRAIIVDEPMDMPLTGAHGIPYYHDPEELRAYLKALPKGSTIIMHQGIQGSDSGEYIQDHSAINKEDVQDFRVISGHYHKRQDIKTGRPRKGAVGLFSYIGNPYTLNFGEANDPEKGFQILRDDGLLEFVPTNLRKHVVIEANTNGMNSISGDINPSDLVWIKLSGPKQSLAEYSKNTIAQSLGLMQDFRLTLEPTDEASDMPVDETLMGRDLLDQLIDNSTNVSADSKERLKSKWKTLLGDSCASSQPQQKTSVATRDLALTSKTRA